MQPWRKLTFHPCVKRLLLLGWWGRGEAGGQGGQAWKPKLITSPESKLFALGWLLRAHSNAPVETSPVVSHCCYQLLDEETNGELSHYLKAGRRKKTSGPGVESVLPCWARSALVTKVHFHLQKWGAEPQKLFPELSFPMNSPGNLDLCLLLS